MPLPLFWLFFITGFTLYFTGKKITAKYLFSISAIWLILITTPFLPRTILYNLENQHPSLNVTNSPSFNDSPVYILVLGSGYVSDDRLSYSNQLNSSGLARLVEAIRLYRIIPGSKLIFSGYSGKNQKPMAKISSYSAQELGIDSSEIFTLCEPWNTKNEVIEYLNNFGKEAKLFVVTDAAHMKRTLMNFQSFGLSPIPAPTNFMIKKSKVPRKYLDYFPGSHNIRYTEIIVHEYLGILWSLMGGD